MGWTVCSLPALSEREPVASMRHPEQHDMEGVWAHLGTLVAEPPPLNVAACQISKVPRGPEGGIARPSCRASGRVSSISRRSPSDFNVTKPHGQLARRAHWQCSTTGRKPNPQPFTSRAACRSYLASTQVAPKPVEIQVRISPAPASPPKSDRLHVFCHVKVLRATKNSPGIGLNGSLTVFCSSQTQDQSARRLFPTSSARSDGEERRGISSAPPCSHHESIDLLHELQCSGFSGPWRVKGGKKHNITTIVQGRGTGTWPRALTSLSLARVGGPLAAAREKTSPKGTLYTHISSPTWRFTHYRACSDSS